MRIQLNNEQQQMLQKVGITIVPDKDYSDNEAFDLLERVYDTEVRYAQTADTDSAARRLAKEYAVIADSIQRQIPE